MAHVGEGARKASILSIFQNSMTKTSGTKFVKKKKSKYLLQLHPKSFREENRKIAKFMQQNYNLPYSIVYSHINVSFN